jgi:hypothetical protein
MITLKVHAECLWQFRIPTTTDFRYFCVSKITYCHTNKRFLSGVRGVDFAQVIWQSNLFNIDGNILPVWDALQNVFDYSKAICMLWTPLQQYTSNKLKIYCTWSQNCLNSQKIGVLSRYMPHFCIHSVRIQQICLLIYDSSSKTGKHCIKENKGKELLGRLLRCYSKPKGNLRRRRSDAHRAWRNGKKSEEAVPNSSRWISDQGRINPRWNIFFVQSSRARSDTYSHTYIPIYAGYIYVRELKHFPLYIDGAL